MKKNKIIKIIKNDKLISLFLVFIVTLFALIISIKKDVINNFGKLKIDINQNQPILGNAVEYISSLAGSSSQDSLDVISGTNLAYDQQKNLRYVGSNPDNYIKFNDELWRIIGVIKIDNTKHLKLVRDNTIGELSWNSTTSDINNGYGSNNWSESVLMKLLNPGYEDNYRINEYVETGKEPCNNSLYWNRQKGKCFTREKEGWDECDYTQTGLKKDYQKLISKVNWNVGSVPDHNTQGKHFNLNITPSEFYEYESSELWNGYVGLLNYTDYAYAVSNENSNRQTCLTKSIHYMDEDNCFSGLYLFDNDKTIGTYGGYNYWMNLLNTEDLNESRLAFGPSGRNINYVLEETYGYHNTKPTIYLNEDVNLKSGIGTKDDPYIIGMRYNVEFNDEDRITNVIVDENTKVDAINSQGKEGYTFKYWSLSKNGVEFDFNTLINESITLYANYEPNDYNVEFYDKNKNHIKTLTAKYDTRLNLYEIPTIDDNTFIGWREQDSKENFNFESTIKRDYKLYAKVVKNCSNESEGVKTLRSKIDDDMIYNDKFGNLRYRGKNANNYVLFNDEMWQIIGTFKVKDKYGISNEKIKIVRYAPLNPGNLVYDTSINSNNGYGINDWSKSDIMRLLNPGYEDNKEELFDQSNQNYISRGENLVNNSLYWNRQNGNCFIGPHNLYSNCDFTTTGLNENSKEYIETIIWNVGAVNSELYNMTIEDLYREERGDKTGKFNMPEISSYEPDNEDREIAWIGNIGLLYDSDVEYSADKTDQFTDEYCNENINNNTSCKRNNSWIVFKTVPSHFLMNPVYGSDPYNVVTDSYGGVTYAGASYSGYYIKPTLYLKSNIDITDGSGTINDPYKLSFYEKQVCNTDVKVTFNDEDRITEKTIEKDTKVETIDSLGKEGHTFKYWSLNKNGEEFDFNTPIEENTTLYAVYKINEYDVEFYNDDLLLDTQRINYNALINEELIPIIEKEGYRFINWTEKDSEDEFDFNTKITRNYKLFANFEIIEKEPEKCKLTLSSDKYNINNFNHTINNVPEKETIDEIKSNLKTEADEINVTQNNVIIKCDNQSETYTINRIWIPQTGQILVNYLSIIGYISIIIVLLIVINKQRQINKNLKKSN